MGIFNEQRSPTWNCKWFWSELYKLYTGGVDVTLYQDALQCRLRMESKIFFKSRIGSDLFEIHPSEFLKNISLYFWKADYGWLCVIVKLSVLYVNVIRDISNSSVCDVYIFTYLQKKVMFFRILTYTSSETWFHLSYDISCDLFEEAI